MDYRRFVIMDVNETGSLDYSQLLESNNKQLRVSGSKAIVGWETENSESMEMPSTISQSLSRSKVYYFGEVLNIMYETEESGSILPTNLYWKRSI
tara:strand:- start:3175 stop:3459 length:285 start_codon:yes stop_codon:yes gene_type:complete